MRGGNRDKTPLVRGAVDGWMVALPRLSLSSSAWAPRRSVGQLLAEVKVDVRGSYACCRLKKSCLPERHLADCWESPLLRC